MSISSDNRLLFQLEWEDRRFVGFGPNPSGAYIRCSEPYRIKTLSMGVLSQ